jgi:hypothetical protein
MYINLRSNMASYPIWGLDLMDYLTNPTGRDYGTFLIEALGWRIIFA